ncbi:MAG: hypothetical protein IJ560_03340 [Alphaproteobacteria bacterium]|nr:hypothetical protein [Alphaproteobacteria bacterium]
MKQDVYQENVVKEALMEYANLAQQAGDYFAGEVSANERDAIRLEVSYMKHIAQNPRRYLHPNRAFLYSRGSTDAWTATVNDDIIAQGGYNMIPYKKITMARNDKVVNYRGVTFASLSPDDCVRVGFDYLCRLIIDFYRDDDFLSLRRLMSVCNFITRHTDESPNVTLSQEDIERENIRSVMPKLNAQRQSVLAKYRQQMQQH